MGLKTGSAWRRHEYECLRHIEITAREWSVPRARQPRRFRRGGFACRARRAASRRQPRTGVRHRSTRLPGQGKPPAGRWIAGARATSATIGGASDSSRKYRKSASTASASSSRTAGSISGTLTRRDCSLLSRAMRTQRSVRLREASKSPFSLRAVSTGRMRSTPSSVAFSTIHSNRSNLIRAAQSVIRDGRRRRRHRLQNPEHDPVGRGLYDLGDYARTGCRKFRRLCPGAARRTRERWRASSPRSSAVPAWMASTKNLRLAKRVFYELDAAGRYNQVL